MAYAAVTWLMGTIDLHFLQSQPRFPLEDLEAQIRDGYENLGLLQQILDDMAMKDRLMIRITDVRSTNAWDSVVLSSRLRELGEVKQTMVSLHENVGFLQESLEKSEIAYDNSGAMKDLEAEMRDVLFKAEERIEMESTTIYLAKGMMRLRKTASLLRLHEILNEARKQTDYLKNELMIRIQSECQQIAKAASSQNKRIPDVSLLGRILRRGLLLVKRLSHKNIIVSKFSKNASNLDSTMVGCHEVFKKIMDQLN